ncbi:MAG: hypothetical protein BGP06_20685 [Rhizobiales bacterium 65-9]|nr:MAG: hypothetical protein BGP06_20685 [Rhizobiales bacterium 65-9]
MRLVAVAEAAGMTHANVYRYFPSRDALADAVTVAWLKPIEAALLDAATAPDPAPDKLERMTLALAQAYRDRLEREPNLFALFVNAVEKARPAARKHRSRVRELLGRVVEEAIGEDADRRDRERMMNLLFDSMHRFISPPNLLQDRKLPRAAFDERIGAVLQIALRSFRSRAWAIDG